MMGQSMRMAGWLELAALKHWGGEAYELTEHPIQGCTETCRVLKLNGRVVCGHRDHPTVFSEPRAISQFLFGLGISDEPRPGAPLELEVDKGRDCLGLGARGLCPCEKALGAQTGGSRKKDDQTRHA